MNRAIQHIRRKLTYFKINLTDSQVRDQLKLFSKTYEDNPGAIRATYDTVKNIRPFLNFIKAGKHVIIPSIISENPLIDSLLSITDFLGLYYSGEVDNLSQYTNGVWIDNGTAQKDTVLEAGLAPVEISNWKNNKSAIEFIGNESLRIALISDNYNLHNTPNTIFTVGQYDQNLATDVEQYITNGNFTIQKDADKSRAQFASGAFGTFYDHGIDYNGVPAFIVGHVLTGGLRTLSFLNGDISIRGVFAAQAFGNTFIGNQSFTGKIASIGVTDDLVSSLELKSIIKAVNQDYAMENTDDNFLIFIGDSLTYGIGLSSPTQSWPYLILSDLETIHSEIFRYCNDAISGIKVTDYAVHENTDVYAFANNYSINNRILFVWLGSNDFAGDQVSAATMLANMLIFIQDRLRAGFKKIIISTVIERIEFINDAGLGAEVDSYNSSISSYDFSSLEAQYGADIRVASLHSDVRLQDPTDLTYFDADEVHLNATGHSVVNDLLKLEYTALRSVTLTEDISNPTVESFELALANTYVDLVLTKGVYGDNLGESIVSLSDFEVTDFSGSGVTAILITSIEPIDTSKFEGGDKRIRFNLSLTGDADGTETFKISAVTDSVYDVFGNVMVLGSNTITLNEAFKDATMYLVGAGAGYSVLDNSATMVDGGGGVGARTSQNVARSTEEVADEDFEVIFSVSDTVEGSGTYGVGVGPAVSSGPFSSALTKHVFAKANGSNSIRGGTNIGVTTNSGITFDPSWRYKLKYIKATPQILLQYSDDGEVTWNTLIDIDNSTGGLQLDLTFPFAVHCAADLFGGQGTVTVSNIKLSPNFI